MKWQKRGLIFAPDGSRAWQRSHAWVPTADPLGGDLFKVYVAGRNADNLSQIGYVTLELGDSDAGVVDVAGSPVVPLGPLGTFDDSAVMPTWIVDHRGLKYLFYTGWMQGRRVPYYAAIGLAVSADGGRTFEKVSRGPLIERDDVDPLMMASACVLIEGGVWRMWYLSNTRWSAEGREPKPRYHIRYAESSDGMHWRREGVVCIDFRDESEYAIARPSVLKDGGLYRMWYSHRGDRYRIGYAESDDGLTWTRRDEEVGIDVSPAGWDSEMIEYAHVFLHRGRLHMLYNGNDYGRSGVGLAVAE